MPTNLQKVSINGARLWQSLMDLAQVGATPKGGNCRLALTALDGQARDLVVGWMRGAGLDIHVDEVGNIFGIRAGLDARLAPVAMGSHIDTQPTGGRFDGCYGVMAGLEVVRTLQEHNIQTQAPLALIIWTNEEGSRFVPVMMGSGVHCGVFSKESVWAAVDADGKRVGDALKAIGYRGHTAIGSIQPACYFEAHIEQGPILEAADKVVGVVTGSLGLRWYDVTVEGLEAHAGPTPMDMRRDALYVAAGVMRSVVDLANAPEFSPHGRGTVGVVHVHPNSRNVIPGGVTFSVDLRHHLPDQLALMDARLRQTCADVQAQSNGAIKVHVHEVSNVAPTPFAPDLVQAVEEAAKARNLPYQRILTGAGHDAVFMAQVVPAAMVFVPCKDGISHNEAEYAKPEHLEAGANVLLDAVLAQAQCE